MFFANLLLVLLCLLFPPQQVGEISGVEITSPAAEAALQGSVSIQGTLAVENMNSYEILFGYANTPLEQAFLLGQGTQPVEQGELAIWDTTHYSDGDYQLIVRVNFADGSHQDTLIPGLRVRNYSPIETPTPNLTPQASVSPATATLVPTATALRQTATAFQNNPGSLSPADVTGSLIRGAGFSIFVVIFLAGYAALRRRSRR